MRYTIKQEEERRKKKTKSKNGLGLNFINYNDAMYTTYFTLI